MIRFFKDINKYIFVLVYVCLLFFAGFFFYEYCTSVGVVLTIILIMIRNEKWRFVNRRSLYVFLFCIGNLIVSDFYSATFNDIGIKMQVLVANILFFFISFLISNSLDYRLYMKSFVTCVSLIALVSIIFFIIAKVDYSLVTKLPCVTNSSGRKGYYALFAIISDFRMAGAQRNQGIFWEPGAFQVILCLAYIFEIADNKKPRIWIQILLLVAMLTTVSTTGIIVAALLLTYSLSSKKGKIKLVRTLVMVIIMLVVAQFVLSNATGFLKYTLVDKIDMIRNYQIGVSTDASSRVDSIVMPILSFLESPLFGIGSGGLEKLVYVTCTPVNWFVQCGILFGVIIIRGIYLFFIKIINNKLSAVILLLIFCFSMMTEAFETNVLILSLVFWGYIVNSGGEENE